MAETSRHERRRHFRGKPRPGRRMPVRWGLAGQWESAETRNIGVGGAFIATATPPPVGTAILVELQVPTSDRGFEVKAIVRWRQQQPGEAVDSPGMGIEFVDVDIDILLELNDYFASLTGGEPPLVR